jgi:cell division protein FtsA
MKNNFRTLYIEINYSNLIFFIGENHEQKNKIIYELSVPIKGIENKQISDFEQIFNLIKDNIYLIEQKLSYTFKEVVLILENLNPKFINLTGFRKLNGSQILKENINYILNTLKSYVDEIESKRTILHIFNSKFFLDKKKIENLPIGLFGDFYSHELSFSLININDHKNLKNIFDECNLKIKKILLKSFLKGAFISDKHNGSETFFHVEINSKNSSIFYFENNSLKYKQDFKFGVDIIINDISKITSLKESTIRLILEKIELSENIPENELIEKEYFEENNYIKIKKKLIYQIALARAQEISELIIHKNINFKYYSKSVKIVFLEIISKNISFNLKQILKTCLCSNDKFDIRSLDSLSSEEMLETLNKIVHFGWKKEAIPITKAKKSIITRFFDTIFG